MMLSIVFLLMYVASSLRSGTNGLRQQMEYNKLAQKAEGLEQQIKVYNTLKDETLRKQSSEAEQQVYEKLMGKLTLLQDEAKQEKDALRAKAKENEEKEYALNQYQQLVRNIINANILAKSQIKHRDQLIVNKDATIEEKKREIAEMEKTVAQDEAQISAIEGQLEAKIKALQAEQQSSRSSKQQLEQRIAALRQESARKISELEANKQAIAKQLGEVKGTLEHTEAKLENTEAEKSRALAAVEDLKGDLAKTRAIANARKALAQQLADQFAKSGLKGAVDGKTGEVTLDFGGEYFETGSTSLKPKMRMTLDKFIPIYAKTLFGDPKLANKIGNVEIVGFASSTFKGKYVNPKSVRPEDKEAIQYNLRLSFGRANAIFSHVLNHSKLDKAERERLLPLMKVVGRGYLPEGKDASDLPDSMGEKDFCERYNCAKAQKVIVKFNMKD